jgi:hypothetical protein
MRLPKSILFQSFSSVLTPPFAVVSVRFGSSRQVHYFGGYFFRK